MEQRHLQSQLPELVSLGPGVLNRHHAAEGDVHPLEDLPPPARQVLPDVLLQGQGSTAEAPLTSVLWT